MYTLEKIKQNIAKEINKTLGKKIVQVSNFVYPPQRDMGDLSLPMFQIAKELGKTPGGIANDLVSKIKIKEILGLKTAGPYLNFSLNKEYLTKEVLDEINKQKEKYGINDSGQRQRVMIEYSNVNTHKEYHVGHLRNICYGDAINRLLSANGFKSIPVSYINDFGNHVAKTLWLWSSYSSEKKEELIEILEKTNKSKGWQLGRTYVNATKKMEEDKTAKQMVEFMMKSIEKRKGADFDSWKETRQWSMEQFDKIYKELGVKFEKTFYESDLIDQGRELVNDLVKKNILKESQGAVIADLEDENLGVLVILRSDGTATYPVADIPLAIEKFEKYKLDKSIYVVDNRQELYFKQLFNILNKLGYTQEMIHLKYDFVKLPDGMMSSRTGNTVTYESLRDALMASIKKETQDRHADWNDKKIEEVARVITNGAIKFEMLKVGQNQVITFDIEKALDFSGFTAAYLQYTYARVNSIIKKADVKLKKVNYKNLKDNKEYGLVLKLSKYSEIVKRTGVNYDPSEIAKYIFELAQLTNEYYHSVPVLKANKETSLARLALLQSINQVIQNGLNLLGIEVVDEM